MVVHYIKLQMPCAPKPTQIRSKLSNRELPKVAPAATVIFGVDESLALNMSFIFTSELGYDKADCYDFNS